MAVFDPVVFDVGIFDASDAVPVLWNVRVVPQHQSVVLGEWITIVIQLVDVDTTPGRTFTLDPATTPQITLYGEDNVIIQAATDMVNIQPGQYRYQYETADTGVHSAVFTADNDTVSMITPKIVVFTVQE